jgi:outer membrane protein assembly factor BamD
MQRFVPFLVLIVATVLFGACSATDPQDLPTAEERFRLGMTEYADGDYIDAIQHFEVIRLQFPGSPVADSARYFLGMSRYNREEYLLGSYEFNQLIQYNPNSTLQADAQYMHAMCYVALSPKSPLDQNYTVRAIDALQSFIETHPRHAKAQDAEKTLLELVAKLAQKEYNTGVLYMKLENYKSAELYFDTVIDKYYNTEFADDAAAMKIRILVRRKQDAQVAGAVAGFVKKYPASPYIDEVQGYGKQLPTP